MLRGVANDAKARALMQWAPPNGEFATAHLVEGVFQVMGEGGHRVKTEHGAAALDGMHGTKGPIHQRHVVRRIFHLQQRGLQVFQQVGGFLAECFLERRHA